MQRAALTKIYASFPTDGAPSNVITEHKYSNLTRIARFTRMLLRVYEF